MIAAQHLCLHGLPVEKHMRGPHKRLAIASVLDALDVFSDLFGQQPLPSQLRQKPLHTARLFG